MTTKTTLIGASSPCDSNSWDNIPWKGAKTHVFRLQVRIAKATREGRFGRVKALQRILTHSFYSKCLAVKRVTSNTGKNTPGIDGEIWRTNLQKIRAVESLRRRGYKPLPLKRIYIPKKRDDKRRPLSIPVMKDRAMQAIWLLALYPVAEEKVGPNSYGFRARRSAHDAIEQCFVALGRKRSAKFVLEGDIKSCFDRISHEWLLKNIPMDKVILQKFLKAQFVEDGKLYPVTAGIPQGGIISPCLTLITLAGLEGKLKSQDERTRKKEKINFIAYADDFVITAASEELLNRKVIPIVDEFLAERGLELSKEKTSITHVEKGFDFLGFNLRKYCNGKMMIKPSKGNIKSFLCEIRKTIKSNIPLQTDKLIHLLNPKITGWSNYYKSVVSSEVFSMVDTSIYKAISSWAKHRHPNKGGPWITKKYFTGYGLNNWRFYSETKDKDGKTTLVHLRRAVDTKIRRHVKIRGAATPFNPEFKEYFKIRDRKVFVPDPSSVTGWI